MNEHARDPYVGLNQYFGRKAAEVVPAWYSVGKVIATSPLKIRADGMDLETEDLYIAEHLSAGWQERLSIILAFDCGASAENPSRRMCMRSFIRRMPGNST